MISRLLVVSLSGVLLASGACDPAGDSASKPEDTFLRMQRFVAEGKYGEVWGLCATETRKQYADGINKFKEIVRSSGINRGEHERLLVEAYGTTIDEFLAMTAEELYGRVMWKTAAQMARFRIAGEAVYDEDRAYLPLTKILDRGTYPTIRMPFVKRSGRWLIADNPIGSTNQLINPSGLEPR